jgi:hypothetical protein
LNFETDSETAKEKGLEFQMKQGFWQILTGWDLKVTNVDAMRSFSHWGGWDSDFPNRFISISWLDRKSSSESSPLNCWWLITISDQSSDKSEASI